MLLLPEGKKEKIICQCKKVMSSKGDHSKRNCSSYRSALCVSSGSVAGSSTYSSSTKVSNRKTSDKQQLRDKDSNQPRNKERAVLMDIKHQFEQRQESISPLPGLSNSFRCFKTRLGASMSKSETWGFMLSPGKTVPQKCDGVEKDHFYSRIRARGVEHGGIFPTSISTGQWKLNPAVFSKICSQWGTPKIDLFASRVSHQIPAYFAWKLDPRSLGRDAFQASWTHLNSYV